MWNIQSFHVVNVRPKGAMFDTDYCDENILSEILMACPVRSHRGPIVHTDNARLHNSKQIREFMEKSKLNNSHLATGKSHSCARQSDANQNKRIVPVKRAAGLQFHQNATDYAVNVDNRVPRGGEISATLRPI
jgi:hypothetical protein